MIANSSIDNQENAYKEEKFKKTSHFLTSVSTGKPQELRVCCQKMINVLIDAMELNQEVKSKRHKQTFTEKAQSFQQWVLLKIKYKHPKE